MVKASLPAAKRLRGPAVARRCIARDLNAWVRARPRFCASGGVLAQAADRSGEPRISV